MEYVRVGNSGLQVSRICLGCMTFGAPSWGKWVLNEADTLPIIKRAYELGINFYDTANVYSNGESERILGNVIRKLKIPRENVVIASKLYFLVPDSVDVNPFANPIPEGIATKNKKGLNRKHIFAAVDASLKRLQTDYIDLYQIHRWDYDTPIEETMEALHDIVKSGKVRYIGASSMHAWQFAKAQHIAELRGWTKFISMQNLLNLLYREEEREMIPLCKDLGVGLIPWSPLAGGMLAGKRDTPRSEVDKFSPSLHQSAKSDDIINSVVNLAKEKGVTPSQVAIAWLLSKSYVTAPIVGVTKVEQLEQLVDALTIKLKEEDIKILEDEYAPRNVVGFAEA